MAIRFDTDSLAALIGTSIARGLGALFLLAAPPLGAAEPSSGPERAYDPQHSRLIAWSVLPASASRAATPPSGSFLTPAERAAAAANGVKGPPAGPYFLEQPIQGFSSMIPAQNGSWWALADNGYAWRENSADWQLVIYRVDPRWETREGPAILESVVLRDPDRRVPWRIVCDQAKSTALPPLSFNVMPPPPRACGSDRNQRVLTGFDFDPESLVRAQDGSFWISDEFGPFLLHVAADGRLLEEPFAAPGVRSPQSPQLSFAEGERPEAPNLAASRGFEGLAISPDGANLYALLEGAVAGDDERDLRVYVFNVAARRFSETFLRLRLEARSQTVNLAVIADPRGARVYPDAVAPVAGAVSIGEIKAVNDHQFLVIERDNLGDEERAPRHKKLFLVDAHAPSARGSYLSKTLLLDLLAIPDPGRVGQEGDFFSLPFYTIESVHVVDERTLLVASDNNFPGSNGRARSRSRGRNGPLAPDATELILVRLGTPLEVDPRLLPVVSSGGATRENPR